MKVGVTDFVDANEAPIDTLAIGEETERDQVEAVAAPADRDGAAAEEALLALKEAATTDVNLMEPLLTCARARCTEGEIVAGPRLRLRHLPGDAGLLGKEHTGSVARLARTR